MARLAFVILLLISGCANLPLENGTQEGIHAAAGEVVISRQGDNYRATRTEVGQLPFAAGADVDASTVNGAVSVRVASRSDAHVLASLWAVGATEADARQKLATLGLELAGPGVEAHVRTNDGSWTGKGGSLTVSLPVQQVGEVSAKATNGGISVHGVQADAVDLMTTNGAIECSATAATLAAATTNGAIACTGTFDNVDASSTNGAITLDGRAAASGQWEASSTNAVIQVTVVEDSARGYDVRAETTNGQITFDFRQTEEIDSSSSYVSHSRHERTTDYGSRAIQTEITMNTVNGPVVAGS